jgi:predicted secreted protein
MRIPKIQVPDQRSKKFIFIPFCLICQAFQAQGIVRYGYAASIKPVIDEILQHGINIIQMPCPESQFGGYENGLRRDPKGIEQYDTPEFRELCQRLASETTEIIKAILANGYEVVAILGMEYSPSCSTRLQYSTKGVFHRPGIFIEALQDRLAKERIELPFIGINRRGINQSLRKLGRVFAQQKSLFGSGR